MNRIKLRVEVLPLADSIKQWLTTIHKSATIAHLGSQIAAEFQCVHPDKGKLAIKELQDAWAIPLVQTHEVGDIFADRTGGMADVKDWTVWVVREAASLEDVPTGTRCASVAPNSTLRFGSKRGRNSLLERTVLSQSTFAGDSERPKKRPKYVDGMSMRSVDPDQPIRSSESYMAGDEGPSNAQGGLPNYIADSQLSPRRKDVEMYATPPTSLSASSTHRLDSVQLQATLLDSPVLRGQADGNSATTPYVNGVNEPPKTESPESDILASVPTSQPQTPQIAIEIQGESSLTFAKPSEPASVANKPPSQLRRGSPQAHPNLSIINRQSSSDMVPVKAPCGISPLKIFKASSGKAKMRSMPTPVSLEENIWDVETDKEASEQVSSSSPSAKHVGNQKSTQPGPRHPRLKKTAGHSMANSSTSANSTVTSSLPSALKKPIVAENPSIGQQTTSVTEILSSIKTPHVQSLNRPNIIGEQYDIDGEERERTTNSESISSIISTKGHQSSSSKDQCAPDTMHTHEIETEVPANGDTDSSSSTESSELRPDEDVEVETVPVKGVKPASKPTDSNSAAFQSTSTGQQVDTAKILKMMEERRTREMAMAAARAAKRAKAGTAKVTQKATLTKSGEKLDLAYGSIEDPTTPSVSVTPKSAISQRKSLTPLIPGPGLKPALKNRASSASSRDAPSRVMHISGQRLPSGRTESSPTQLGRSVSFADDHVTSHDTTSSKQLKQIVKSTKVASVASENNIENTPAIKVVPKFALPQQETKSVGRFSKAIPSAKLVGNGRTIDGQPSANLTATNISNRLASNNHRKTLKSSDEDSDSDSDSDLDSEIDAKAGKVSPVNDYESSKLKGRSKQNVADRESTSLSRSPAQEVISSASISDKSDSESDPASNHGKTDSISITSKIANTINNISSNGDVEEATSDGSETSQSESDEVPLPIQQVTTKKNPLRESSVGDTRDKADIQLQHEDILSKDSSQPSQPRTKTTPKTPSSVTPLTSSTVRPANARHPSLTALKNSQRLPNNKTLLKPTNKSSDRKASLLSDSTSSDSSDGDSNEDDSSDDESVRNIPGKTQAARTNSSQENNKRRLNGILKLASKAKR